MVHFKDAFPGVEGNYKNLLREVPLPVCQFSTNLILDHIN